METPDIQEDLKWEPFEAADENWGQNPDWADEFDANGLCRDLNSRFFLTGIVVRLQSVSVRARLLRQLLKEFAFRQDQLEEGLWAALAEGITLLADMLADFGAVPTLEMLIDAVSNHAMIVAVRWLLERRPSLAREQDPISGQTPVIAAIQNCSPISLQLLLQQKPDLGAFDWNGRRAADYLKQLEPEHRPKFEEMVRKFEEEGGGVSIVLHEMELLSKKASQLKLANQARRRAWERDEEISDVDSVVKMMRRL